MYRPKAEAWPKLPPARRTFMLDFYITNRASLGRTKMALVVVYTPRHPLSSGLVETISESAQDPLHESVIGFRQLCFSLITSNSTID